jgi:hypothetical protein
MNFGNFVEIAFDCLPLRSIGRLDVPLDASPNYRAFCERLKTALARHGSHNAYYLHRAHCTFHLTNKPEVGMLEFRFEGTVLTDPDDAVTIATDLETELVRETCDWLVEPAVAWFRETVEHAVRAEFDRYIEAGDLAQAIARAERLKEEMDRSGGYLGMYL